MPTVDLLLNREQAHIGAYTPQQKIINSPMSTSSDHTPPGYYTKTTELRHQRKSNVAGSLSVWGSKPIVREGAFRFNEFIITSAHFPT